MTHEQCNKLIWNSAARDAFRLSFPITKTEKLDDGRLAVFGVATRFIPTPVGNTHDRTPHSDPHTVHPHARGEHEWLNKHQEHLVGSSPRPWGTRDAQARPAE